MWLLFLALFVLGILALFGFRWAYLGFVVLGLLYFPARVGFRLDPQPCELTFGLRLAVHSLTNYAHIVMFALFFVMTSAQFRMTKWSDFAWAATVTIVMGALVEIGEGVSGRGHCRLRDLIPDIVGILLGSLIVVLKMRISTRLRTG